MREAFSHAQQNRIDWRSLRPLVILWLPQGTYADFRGNAVMNSSHKIYGLVTQTVKHDSLIPRVHHKAAFEREMLSSVLRYLEIKEKPSSPQ